MLELKVRTASLQRQRRQRVGGWLWNASAVIVVLVLLAVAGRLCVEKFFLRNAEYSLKHLDARLNGAMTEEQLVKLTGFSTGKNLFLLDLDEANRKLAATPEVRSANVERILPDTIRVTLERRVPVFLFAGTGEGEASETFIPGKSYLCDNAGVMLRPERLDPEFLALPVIRGIDLTGAEPGKPLGNERLTYAIGLAEALSEMPEETLKVRSIDVSKPYDAIVTDASNARFTFGNHDLPGQLDRMRKLLAHCQETGRRIETANLMVVRNTPVTFVFTPESGGKITPVTSSKKPGH
jgi:hypothetical protein